MTSAPTSSVSSDGKATTESPVETPPATKLANYPLIPRSELKILEQLGAGTYGSVFKGLWTPTSQAMNGGTAKEGGSATPTTITVALKKVFILEKEVDILMTIRHRNIIQVGLPLARAFKKWGMTI